MKKFLHKLFFRVSVGITVIAIFIAIIGFFTRSIINEVPTPRIDIRERSRLATEALLSPENMKRPEQKILLGLYSNVSCGLIGEGCYKQTQENRNNSVAGGLVNLIGATYKNPPASGINETYNTIANIGLAPKTYAAQGIGFGSISGFRPVWIIFRNISYSILVLVMVVISFMIMFRMKLNAQTAISIESALPRIVLSLILITFSYALAGFLIDAMYVVMGICVTLLCGNNLYCDAHTKLNQYLNAGLGQIWSGFFPYEGKPIAGMGWLLNLIGIKSTVFNLSGAILEVLPNAVTGSLYVVGSLANLAIANYVFALLHNTQFFELTKNLQAFTFGTGGVWSFMIGTGMLGLYSALSYLTLPLLLGLIIYLTMIFLFFRIFFMIFTTYLNLLFLILFSPILMLIEALPGQSTFSYWLRNMIGELLTFPLLAVFLMVGALIVNNFQFIDKVKDPGTLATQIWQPPFLSGFDSGTQQGAFLMVIGMGIIFIIPDLIKMIKDMLGVKPPTVSISPGTFLAGGALAWGGGMSLLGSAYKLSGAIYGNDAAGREKGIQGMIARRFSAMRGPFYKKTAPVPNAAKPDQEAQKQAFISSHWGDSSDPSLKKRQTGSTPLIPRRGDEAHTEFLTKKWQDEQAANAKKLQDHEDTVKAENDRRKAEEMQQEEDIRFRARKKIEEAEEARKAKAQADADDANKNSGNNGGGGTPPASP